MSSSSKNLWIIKIRVFFIYWVFLQRQQFATVSTVKEHGAGLDLKGGISSGLNHGEETKTFHSFLCGGAHTIHTRTAHTLYPTHCEWSVNVHICACMCTHNLGWWEVKHLCFSCFFPRSSFLLSFRLRLRLWLRLWLRWRLLSWLRLCLRLLSLTLGVWHPQLKHSKRYWD